MVESGSPNRLPLGPNMAEVRNWNPPPIAVLDTLNKPCRSASQLKTRLSAMNKAKGSLYLDGFLSYLRRFLRRRFTPILSHWNESKTSKHEPTLLNYLNIHSLFKPRPKQQPANNEIIQSNVAAQSYNREASLFGTYKNTPVLPRTTRDEPACFSSEYPPARLIPVFTGHSFQP